MKRILIVEDHTIVRQGIVRILRDELDFPVEFDEAPDGQTAIGMTDNRLYDLVLLDISLPGQNGLSILKQLRQRNPKLPVIILSTHPEEHYAIRTLRAGAMGYITKAAAAVELKTAIVKVLAGGKHLSPTQAELLADALFVKSDNSPLHTTLSDREFQLVCMITAGKTLTEIAGELALSVKTVSTYRTRVLEKLQLRTTADIINYCIQNKLCV
jgi:DNA-binding NarL/FixJ family response regulator